MLFSRVSFLMLLHPRLSVSHTLLNTHPLTHRCTHSQVHSLTCTLSQVHAYIHRCVHMCTHKCTLTSALSQVHTLTGAYSQVHTRALSQVHTLTGAHSLTCTRFLLRPARRIPPCAEDASQGTASPTALGAPASKPNSAGVCAVRTRTQRVLTGGGHGGLSSEQDRRLLGSALPSRDSGSPHRAPLAVMVQ